MNDSALVFYDTRHPETVVELAQRCASQQGLQNFLWLVREQRRVRESPISAAKPLPQMMNTIESNPPQLPPDHGHGSEVRK